MKQHRLEDSKKKEKQILCQEIKKVRESDEEIFLSKLRESRAFILNDTDPMEVRLLRSNELMKGDNRRALVDAMDLSRGIDSAVFGATFPSFRSDYTIARRSTSRPSITSLFPSSQIAEG